MLYYTIEELKYLGSLIDKRLGNNSNDFCDLVGYISKEFNEEKDIIHDIMAYYLAMSSEDCEDSGMDFLAFEIDLLCLFPYIKSEKVWESLIAEWRVLIEK